MNYIDIVFDGPPDHNAPHFVEVEDSTGKSIRLGDWIKRDDGYWALRIPHDAEGNEPAAQPLLTALRERIAAMDPYTAQGARDSGFGFADISTEYVKAFKDCVLDIFDEALSKEQAESRLPDSALSRLGQAMLADYPETDYLPSRGEIAMHLGAGAMATEGGNEHWADHEKFADFVVARTDALLAKLSKPT